jgi:pyruvate/2-oxoglutarate/acetoin dehydrogenase E1 component
VLRVTNRDVPMPYAPNLEKQVIITPERIVEAARTTMGKK